MRDSILRFCFILCVVAVSATTLAQAPVAQQFADADWFSRPLAPGVNWKFYQFDNLFAGPQDIVIIEADMDVPGVRAELPFRNGTKKTTDLITDDYPGAAGGMNGGFFRWNGTATYLRSDGVDAGIADTWGNWGYQGGFVFNNGTNQYRVIQRPKDTGGAAKAVADWKSLTGQYPNMMVNGPLLVRNGAITSSKFANLGNHCNRNPRSMVGMKPGNIVVLVVADGRHPGHAIGLTCEEMAEVMKALGCTDALSLDGGGSSLMYGRGEPFSGILNYPSDNGGWDHDPKDERRVANAIAIIGNAPIPLAYDAEVEISSMPGTIQAGTTQYVGLKLKNIGSATWKDQRVSITTSRSANHASQFYAPDVWPDASTAWVLPPGTEVAPGQTYQVYFKIQGPAVPAKAKVSDYFRLTLYGATRFGPADDAIKVVADVTPATRNILVESRAGGVNHSWYSEAGDWADTGVDCTAFGATPDIGMRYGSTFRSRAGAKAASYLPTFPQRGFYRVYAAWGNAGSRRSPITYKIKHRGGTETLLVSQIVPVNEWVEIGDRAYEFDAGRNGGQGLEMSNENIDVSGSMYAGPVWFEYFGTSSVGGWELY